MILENLVAKEAVAEVWRDVVGYEGVYQVSSFGRVKSLARLAYYDQSINKRAYTIRVPERFLHPHVNTSGYLRVTLYLDKKESYRQIHTLVAEAFIGPRPEGAYVCHNDGSRTNNHVDNLRYDTPLGNSRDMIRHGRSCRGEKHTHSKLTNADIERIVEMRISGVSNVDIAKHFGTCTATIVGILFGSRRSYLELPEIPRSFGRDDEKLEMIREARRSGMTLAQLTEKFGVPRSTASRICKGISCDR